MERWTSNTGCTARCFCCYRGYVPMPRQTQCSIIRRDPLIEAARRMDNPCDRPIFCPPECCPHPKFCGPYEHPMCCKENYPVEEYQEKCCGNCCSSPCCCPSSPCLQIQPGSCGPCGVPMITSPMVIQASPNICASPAMLSSPAPPEGFCRTNIIAGFFNPNDNKSEAQIEMESKICSCGLPPYPCRGVIRYPPQCPSG